MKNAPEGVSFVKHVSQCGGTAVAEILVVHIHNHAEWLMSIKQPLFIILSVLCMLVLNSFQQGQMRGCFPADLQYHYSHLRKPIVKDSETLFNPRTAETQVKVNQDGSLTQKPKAKQNSNPKPNLIHKRH